MTKRQSIPADMVIFFFIIYINTSIVHLSYDNCIVVYWLTSSSGVWQIIVFEPWSGQTKDYTIGVCCISTKHTTVKSKNNNWLAQNHDNVSE